MYYATDQTNRPHYRVQAASSTTKLAASNPNAAALQLCSRNGYSQDGYMAPARVDEVAAKSRKTPRQGRIGK
jgi:hypothetical protein